MKYLLVIDFLGLKFYLFETRDQESIELMNRVEENSPDFRNTILKFLTNTWHHCVESEDLTAESIADAKLVYGTIGL